MSSISTTWPKRERSLGVSMTTRPVTQTADVDVKNALRTESGRPGAPDTGRLSRMPPTVMRPRMCSDSNWAGES